MLTEVRSIASKPGSDGWRRISAGPVAPLSWFQALAAAVTLSLCTLATPTMARAETDEAREVAHRALLEGDRLLREGRHTEAIASWRAGLRALPHWAMLLRIGETYRRMDRCDLALPYYRMGWAWRGEDFTDDMRPELEAAVADCTSRMPARLEVVTNIGGATIFVDDRPVARTPMDPVELPPGRHVVRAERAGHGSVETAVRVSRGETSHIQLVLPVGNINEPIAGPPRLTPAQAAARARQRRGRILGGVFLGLGLALAAGGALLLSFDEETTSDGLVVSTMAPAILVFGLGGAFSAGGITLFALVPPARR